VSSGAAHVVVVAAIGCELRRDDGVGPAVVGRARANLDGLAEVSTLAAPLDLLGRWDGAALAVVVDALRGDEPGTVQVVELVAALSRRTLGVGAPGSSSHGLGVVEAFRLADVLGTAPPRVVLVGVTGADFGAGPGLSPCVAAAVDAAAGVVVEVVRSSRATLHLSRAGFWPARSREVGPPWSVPTRARRPV
jgi:hydrogenase maturation protease